MTASGDSGAMRATAETLVALLRAQLGTGDPPVPDRLGTCDWACLERLSVHHGLSPILYQALRDESAQVPDDLRRRLKLEYYGTALRNRLVQELVDDIARTLHARQIPVILLKGAALLRTLYDDAGLRPVSDIDLLVEESDVDRTGEQLRLIGLQLGAPTGVDRRGPLCHIHALYYRPDLRSIPVELHWRLFESYNPYVFDLTEVWARARQVPGMPATVCTMSAEHELAHLCLHLERHAIVYRSLIARHDWFDLLLLPQGLGRLLWLYDIALSLQRRASAMDWDYVVGRARRWAIDAHLHAVLELCHRALGVAPPPEVMQALHHGRPRLVERLAHGVVLASHRANDERERRPGRHRSRWATTVSAHVLRVAHTWTSVFPPATYLRAQYPTHTSAVWLRTRHLRDVLPGLWAETRDRLRSAANTRRRNRNIDVER